VVLQAIGSGSGLLGLGQRLTPAIRGATLAATMGTRSLLVSLLTGRRDAGR
jgi:hypothetical protein